LSSTCCSSLLPLPLPRPVRPALVSFLILVLPLMTAPRGSTAAAAPHPATCSPPKFGPWPTSPLPSVTFYNQEDTVTNQLRNGVRGLMLDMYDFENDIWLCHSFQGQCYNFTAFEPAINTLKEVEEFMTENPLEIVTIIIEEYVRSPKGLTKLFTDAGLVKFWYPISEIPMNGMDWPSVTDMVAKNHRLLVFTSDASKEANEGIVYQRRYMAENENVSS
ncbi:unnamed protein product, partial [Musa banksii]